ncbi:hypothetical protein [Nocardia sp. NPDC049149]|uniref:hypothetical protein n=1 Tax=Nocardia sp. NPDC049149 TaxID=3364315 RepID=UPI003717E11D
MQKVSFQGSINRGNATAVQTALSSWLDSDLTMKVHYAGFETTFEDDTISIYCYQAYADNDVLFLLEGSMQSELPTAAAKLESLAQICRESQLDCTVDYSEVDEDDDPISDEFTIRSTS